MAVQAPATVTAKTNRYPVRNNPRESCDEAWAAVDTRSTCVMWAYQWKIAERRLREVKKINKNSVTLVLSIGCYYVWLQA